MGRSEYDLCPKFAAYKHRADGDQYSGRFSSRRKAPERHPRGELQIQEAVCLYCHKPGEKFAESSGWAVELNTAVDLKGG